MIDSDKMVSHIRTAAEEVFSTMLGTELRFTESYCDKGPSHPLDGVICLIGMAGEWTGTGTTSCSAEFACRIASQMLMAEYAVVDADVLDAVAEIANMILGNVKTALEKSLGTMGMSIPTAIFGKNFLAKSFGDETWTVVVFECDGQRLEVKLFLKPAGAGPGPGSSKTCTPVYLRA
ncbi:MAG: chemotaxis protein CheX [Bryobacteraceae bacterium]